MTNAHGDTVRLSPANWLAAAGIVMVLATSLLTGAFVVWGKLAVVEAKLDMAIDDYGRRIQVLERAAIPTHRAKAASDDE